MSNQDILFNRRELKSLLKLGYLYLTFDSSVVAWKKKPYFVPSEHYKRTPEENIKHGLWINASPNAGIYRISSIQEIEDSRIHIYSIQKLLEIIPNSDQKE